MATVEAAEVKSRLVESRSVRSSRSKGASVRHKAKSQHDTVKESEQSLHKLLEDFEEGRLNAFGGFFISLFVFFYK